MSSSERACGRLDTPLVELQGTDLPRWLEAHPDGFVVVYMKDRHAPGAIPARHKQEYRSGAVVLVDARTAARLLAARTD